ncbi:MAG: hypothetical protein IKF90_09965 [Parasporobacterium sp.]|nr:hypothetical protein [Parasporobacterium sp.]
MSENTVQNLKEQCHMSEKEFDLLQELMKEHLKENEELQFESLADYELPPRTQFALQNKPSVTLKGNKMQFSMSAVRMFKEYRYIIPMINAKTKRISIIPCMEEDSATVEWSRIQASTGKLQSKQITSEDFIRKIFDFMGWRADCRYKIIGRLAYSEHGMILVFDLEEAVMHAPKKQQIYDPISGTTKMKDVKYYPDRYKNCFGMTYSDYIAMKNQNELEQIGDYEHLANVDLQNAAETDTPATSAEAVVQETVTPMLPELINNADQIGSSNDQENETPVAMVV